MSFDSILSIGAEQVAEVLNSDWDFMLVSEVCSPYSGVASSQTNNGSAVLPSRLCLRKSSTREEKCSIRHLRIKQLLQLRLLPSCDGPELGHETIFIRARAS